MHDIGLVALKDAAGNIGFRVAVGGGLGRTPIVGTVIRDFVPGRHLITYLEAILRVYNRLGRRDNKYKARIKILVKESTPAQFTEWVEAEFRSHQERADAFRRPRLTPSRAALPGPTYKDLPQDDAATVTFAAGHDDFALAAPQCARASGAWLCRRLCLT